MSKSYIFLTFNVGSSSLKCAAFFSEQACLDDEGAAHDPLFHANVDLNTGKAKIKSAQMDAVPASLKDWQTINSLEEAAIQIVSNISSAYPDSELVCIHRLVHGGEVHDDARPRILDGDEIALINKVKPLFPLHLPAALSVIEAIEEAPLQALQLAVFDTTFHKGRPALWSTYAVPEWLREQGVKSYGFHGLSYQSVLHTLTGLSPELAERRLIVAHLGSGASVTAINHGCSVHSTLGFSGLDGVPMGTRPGSLDAGVVLYMMQIGMTPEAIQNCLYKESGLLGLSGISNNMQTLVASDDPRAQFSVEHFSAHVAQAIAGLMVSIQGMDGLVFTGGIGENEAVVRHKICQRLAYLGLAVDTDKNHAPGDYGKISTADSAAEVWVISTNEEREMLLAGQRAITQMNPVQRAIVGAA